MKIALVTTTIHVPTVLKLYRVYGPSACLIVAGDRKSPHDEILSLLRSLTGDWVYVYDGEPITNYGPFVRSGPWRCSELIGWNCIQRRNIATLWALFWGADIIVSIDDDNFPMSSDYFTRYRELLYQPYNGLMLQSDGWINYNALLRPPVCQRGIPFNVSAGLFETWSVTDCKIGVATGAILGNPDISAAERLGHLPDVHGVHELMRTGVIISQLARTVFNSQNTAILRRFAPAFFMLPGVGRMDDIFASLICLRLMREDDYHLHVGQPFAYQQRNEHNLLKDLAAELPWYDRIDEFANVLDSFDLSSYTTVVDQVRQIYSYPALGQLLPQRTLEAAHAWCDDCEEAMK